MTLGSDGSETKVAAWRATAGVCGACNEKDMRRASSGLASNLRDSRIRGRHGGIGLVLLIAGRPKGERTPIISALTSSS